MKITVISTDNPARVETVIDPVKLQDGDSMDLVSIYYQKPKSSVVWVGET